MRWMHACVWVGGALALSVGWAANRAQPWQPPAWGPLEPGLVAALPAPITQPVVVNGGHFVTAGPDQRVGTADDRRMRWFGVNLSGDAAFPTESDAPRLARTLASWGFNAVRLHYIDGPPSPPGSAPSSVLGPGPYPTFNPLAVARLRHFMEQLRLHGLYVQLNPIAAHRAQPGRDGVPPLTPDNAPLPHNNPLAALHAGLRAQQQAYLKGLAAALDLKHQPALAQVDLVNESSLLATWTAWDPQRWSTWVQGDYARLWAEAWQRWVVTRHGSVAQALKAWGYPPNDTAPLPLPTPQSPAPDHGGTGPRTGWRDGLARWVARLPTAWQTRVNQWVNPVPGHTLMQDHLAFLADLDRRHVEALRDTLRAATRPDLPVAGTQASDGGGWNHHAHAGMDFTDDHFYADHYQFPGRPWDFDDWYVRRESLSDNAWERFEAQMSLRTPGRPYVLSEFGQPYPNALGAGQVLALATVARQQDWDGLFLFDHTALDAGRTAPATFDLQGDWPRALTSALASHLFLHGTLAAQPATLPTQAPDPAALAQAWLTQRRPDYWQRSLAAHGKLPRLFTPSDTAHAPSPGLVRDGVGRMWAHTPEGAWASGLWVGGATGTLGDWAWRMPLGSEPQPLTLAWLRLNAAPSGPGARWLLTVLPPTLGSQPGTVPAQAHRWVPHPSGEDRWTLAPAPGSGKPSSPPMATIPLWTETTPLELRWTAQRPPPEVWQLNVRGQRVGRVLLSPHPEGGWRLPLQPAPGAPPRLWFELVDTQAPP